MSSGPLEEGKLFVGGLAPETTTETLAEYFEPLGALRSQVHCDQSGKSKCFGFVVFESHFDALAVLELSHNIDGRDVDVKPSIAKQRQAGNERPRRSGAAQRPPSVPNQSLKVFLGGLSRQSTKESLEAYFCEFGPCTGVVMWDTDSGKPRGFGFVVFTETSSVEQVLMQEDGSVGGTTVHYIDGKAVECRLWEEDPPMSKPNQLAQARCSPSPTRPLTPPAPPAPPPHSRSFIAPPAPPAHCGALTAPSSRRGRASRGFDAFSGGPRVGPPAAPAPKFDPFEDDDNVSPRMPPLPPPPLPSASFDPLRVFVGGVPRNCDNETFAKSFSEFGNIVEARLVFDKHTGAGKGYGYVTYDDPSTVDLIVTEDVYIESKLVDVKRCEFRNGASQRDRHVRQKPQIEKEVAEIRFSQEEEKAISLTQRLLRDPRRGSEVESWLWGSRTAPQPPPKGRRSTPY